ncbi:hypothetical protein ET132_12350, partial [Klebsiella pneumoniae]
MCIRDRVRLYDKGVPAVKSVEGLPFCDIGFAVQDDHLIVVAAEDKLLKVAAAQAVQCANNRFGFDDTQSLICLLNKSEAADDT